MHNIKLCASSDRVFYPFHAEGGERFKSVSSGGLLNNQYKLSVPIVHTLDLMC